MIDIIFLYSIYDVYEVINMSIKYDTVVIGAGPAGSACGITLQRRGVKNCVIEKAVFPRSKTCAGLVTGKAYKLITKLFAENDTDFLFCDEAGEIRLFQKQNEVVSAPLSTPVRLVKRRHFDNALAMRYKDLDGELFEGEKIARIDYSSNKIKLKNGKTIEYKYLVFADGALSLAHKRLNIKKETLAFGIETYISKEILPTDSIDIYFEYLDDGYVWVFPHGDTVCVGAANRYDKNTDYKGIIRGFLSDMGVNPDEAKYVGAFLPYGFAVTQNKLPGNVMLIGDAAGFTDPISGEGLYMSMKSGICAAEAMLTKNPKLNYLESVKPLKRNVTDGRRVQKLFYSKTLFKKILKKANGKKRFVSFFFDNAVEEYNYGYRQMSKLYKDYKRGKK